MTKKLKTTFLNLYRREIPPIQILATAIEVQGGFFSFLMLLISTIKKDGISMVKPKIILLYHSGCFGTDLKRHPFFQLIRRTKYIFVIAVRRIQQLGGMKAAFFRFLHIIQKEGVGCFAQKWRLLKHAHNLHHNRNNYALWVECYEQLTSEQKNAIFEKIAAFPYHPKISVVMPVFNPPPLFLKQALDSVINQFYTNWELCIADDASNDPAVRELLESYQKKEPRIRLRLRTENGHISEASNDALTLASGDFIALMDHDDLLPLHALFYIAEAIIHHPEAGLIYSDEDKIDATGNRHTPHFKPDWNPVFFLSNNYICHFAVYRTDLIRKIGGFRKGYEGAQDYDLALRCIPHLNDHEIIHIPKVLYHWRAHPGSTALALEEKPYFAESGKRALEDYLEAAGIKGSVEYKDSRYRIHYALPEEAPLVTIIILTRDKFSLLRQCVESVLNKTTYPNYEILIIDNGSVDKDTLYYLDQLQQYRNIRVARDPQPFNYSSLTNNAAKHANGSLLCLLNNDTEIISPDWLSEMCALALQPKIGAVGASLWYPDETLQHGGIILGVGSIAAHAHRHFPRGHDGYMGRKVCPSNFSAVTAACLVVRTPLFHEVGGLNEQDLTVAFNDVDFCLKLLEAGYRNAWTPYAELYHHESATRGSDATPEKQIRFQQEILYMQKRWQNSLLTDSSYNPNLTIELEDWSLKWHPKQSDKTTTCL